uniref:uncharacterized protein n=1 Tax=Myxine glutinosa TaxID=7769 RepID=UPI00358F2FC8
MEKIRWTDKEYSLLEFEEQFACKLPIIIKVTDGYMGQQELDTISAETCVWIQCKLQQWRILAEDSTGTMFSIPLKLQKPKFYPLSQHGCKEEGPFKLRSILIWKSLPLDVVTENEINSCVFDVPVLSGRLKLIKTCQVTFLLGYVINEKGILLTMHPMVIPTYIRPLKFTVAEGLLDDDPDEWQNFCDCYQRCTSSLSDVEDGNILEDILTHGHEDVFPWNR